MSKTFTVYTKGQKYYVYHKLFSSYNGAKRYAHKLYNANPSETILILQEEQNSLDSYIWNFHPEPELSLRTPFNPLDSCWAVALHEFVNGEKLRSYQEWKSVLPDDDDTSEVAFVVHDKLLRHDFMFYLHEHNYFYV